MEVAATLLRTVGMYLFVFFVLRLMGKREIGKLSVFDLVISIMIAEIAAMVIEEPAKPVWMALAPILFLVLIQLGIAYISMKNHVMGRWFEGKPRVLIRHGHLSRKEMAKERYNLEDLMTHLRQHKITNIQDVELAVLETTGDLSVIPRDGGQEGYREGERRSVKADAYPKVRYEMLPLALVLDGQVQDENLQKVGKTRFWLKKELQSYGVDNFKDVFFCSLDHKGKLYVDKK